MIKIGNLEFKNNIFLAPMAGVTDLAFRLVCKKWGAGLVFSEMISAKALHYNDKKTLALLETRPQESPLGVQIFGREPDIMLESAQKLESMGAKLLDINFGCPAPKITSNGEGSALLKEPKLMADIIKTVCSGVKIPVMCKIRSGYDDFMDTAELAKIAEQSGAAALTVHGRTREMFYSGLSDSSYIARAKAAVSIPVVGNGDITSPQGAANMFEQTGCDAVMIGRGAQGNPFIFGETNEYLKTGKVPASLGPVQRLEHMKEHITLMCELKGEYLAVRESRKHIAWYTKGMHAGATFRADVFKTETFDRLIDMIDEYIEFIKRREDLQ